MGGDGINACRRVMKHSSALPKSGAGLGKRSATNECAATSARTNVLTMLDLGGIPLHAKDRTLEHPLILAGGPGAQNPELLAPFIDIFIIGDGEESLPWLMDQWMELKERAGRAGSVSDRRSREDMLA